MSDTHEKKVKKLYLYPFILSAGIIILDQLTKLIVIRTIPKLNTAPGDIKRILGEFVWLINISNRGAMFSVGDDLQGHLRTIILMILPILLILYLMYFVACSSYDKKSRWIAAIIVGGGIGNMIDRLFRVDGVVDFVSVKFFGIFGMERWPTFNVADSSIVVGMILWFIFTLFPQLGKKTQHTTRNAEIN